MPPAILILSPLSILYACRQMTEKLKQLILMYIATIICSYGCIGICLHDMNCMYVHRSKGCNTTLKAHSPTKSIVSIVDSHTDSAYCTTQQSSLKHVHTDYYFNLYHCTTSSMHNK